MSAATRALLRIREEMAQRHLSQRDLADALDCSQGRIAKILNGGVNLRVVDLESLCRAVGISLTEAIRDRGLEFYAELTPSEVRVLERLRRRPKAISAVMDLLDIDRPPESSGPVQKRRARGRPLARESSSGR